MLTRARLETEVLDKINEDILEEMKNYVKNKEEQPNLWGVNKDQPGFRSYLILLTLYKDLYGVGYNKLKRRIPTAFHMSNDSLSYNIRQMRFVLGTFGLEKISLGTRQSWNRGGKLVRLDNVPPEDKSGPTHIHFLLDSVDFKIKGKNRRLSGTASEYSWKEKHQALRYQVLTNTRGIVKRVWGPISPKTFDGDWLKLMAETLPESLTGAVILADGHYAWGREKESIPGVRFLVPYPQNQLHMNTEVNNTEARQTPRMVLGKKRQNYNSILEGVRGRVESPFGLMKQRWKALEGKFSDKKDHQHRALVALALAVENLSRRE